VLRRAVAGRLTRLSSWSLIKPMKREPRHLRGFRFRRDGLGSTKSAPRHVMDARVEVAHDEPI